MDQNENQNRLENIRKQIKDFPMRPGLYFMKDTGERVLYVGKAKNLRSRVASYFQPAADLESSRGPKIVEMVNKVVSVDYLEADSEVEAMLKEARLIKDIRPPYNTSLTDDKTFPYLEITTRDHFPGVYLTREPRPHGSRLFGPFAGGGDLRATIVELQKIFKFRTCYLDIHEDDPKRRFFRPCLLYNIKQCTAPCGARVSRQDYRKQIGDFIKFLKSKRTTVLRELRKNMEQASGAQDYEKAGMYRDRIRLIENLEKRGTPEEHVQPEAFVRDPNEAVVRLQKVLKSPKPIRIIECVDIAHVAGTDAVGSLVKFIDGKPFKDGYRRFKIKTVEGVDDYAMIAEVLRRRFKFAVRGEELWPDMVLIDGGIGQLHAAEKVFKEMLQDLPAIGEREKLTPETIEETAREIKDTVLASIAKREELVFVKGRAAPLKLPRNDTALRLLQYARDEAHRFAQHYHHILRRKNMLDE